MKGAKERADSLVLAVLSGNESDAEIVSLACHMAQRRGAALRGIFVIEVPRCRPLSCCDEASEERARAALAAAREQARKSGCILEGCVQPTRDAGQAIVGDVVESAADVVVMAKPYKSRQGDAARHVLDKAPCTVLVRALKGSS